ncbi:MAG TPA: cupin domain-containing protein [Pseudothermotoga sp.]|uniref:cupin domain-containing protein n=1 Tax=Thermotoga profunda TaxID=1508420 RepID=UPI000597D9BB|nr:cupin domain-containing protein [Thermotoga profunda]
MVINAHSMRTEKITNMRNGKGEVEILHLVEKQFLFGKSRLFAKLSIKPGSSIGTHKHENEFEIFYVLSGKGLFNDNGNAIPVQAGDICFTAPGETHSIENTSQQDLEILAIIVLV